MLDQATGAGTPGHLTPDLFNRNPPILSQKLVFSICTGSVTQSGLGVHSKIGFWAPNLKETLSKTPGHLFTSRWRVDRRRPSGLRSLAEAVGICLNLCWPIGLVSMPDSFTRGDGFAVCYFFAALLNTEKTESWHSFDFYFDPLCRNWDCA